MQARSVATALIGDGKKTPKKKVIKFGAAMQKCVREKTSELLLKATLSERSPALNRKVLVLGYKKCHGA